VVDGLISGHHSCLHFHTCLPVRTPVRQRWNLVRSHEKKTSTHASYRNSESGRASTDAVLRDDHGSKILNQTQPNPWVDPTYGQLWDDC